ncbi:protein NETWORKED 3C-like [Euphorbia lathyris]|uniref:protein NETWORKED 3C-like n=1 Tax=Euphorbia lathyris TaxID=212925 RepID=UPI0033141AEF
MVEMIKRETSYWWWFDSHQHSSIRSPWLQSTLGDLNKKTTAMLKLIEEDADSFAQRAEMYYKKRPELISMVEDFYKTHRSLAERFDLLKSESANRLVTTLGHPFSAKYGQAKLMAGMDQFDKNYDSSSETASYDTADSAESEVDDPEQEDETLLENEMGEVEEVETEENEIVGIVCNDEVMKLQEEIERLKEENRIQKDLLLQKDEEKREVIRQLSFAVEILKVENVNVRKAAARDPPKKKSRFEFEKLKNVFSGKFFNGSARSRGRVVAL